jgi:hypothetical protein
VTVALVPEHVLKQEDRVVGLCSSPCSKSGSTPWLFPDFAN